MDHTYIKDHFISERFVSGDLSREERREFFEHCLECSSCREEIYIGKKIEEALERFHVEPKFHAPVTRTRKNKYIPVVASLILIVAAFMAGKMLNNPGSQTTENTLTDNTKQKVPEAVKNVQVVDSGTTKPAFEKQEQKYTGNTPVTPRQPPLKNEPVYSNFSEEPVLLAMEDKNLQEFNSMFKIVPEVIQRSGSQQAVSADKVIEGLSQLSDFISPVIFIDNPLPNSAVPGDKPIEIRWHSKGDINSFQVILINADKKKVSGAWLVRGLKLILNTGLAEGDYFLLVKEKDGRNNLVLRFRVVNR